MKSKKNYLLFVVRLATNVQDGEIKSSTTKAFLWRVGLCLLSNISVTLNYGSSKYAFWWPGIIKAPFLIHNNYCHSLFLWFKCLQCAKLFTAIKQITFITIVHLSQRALYWNLAYLFRFYSSQRVSVYVVFLMFSTFVALLFNLFVLILKDYP